MLAKSDDKYQHDEKTFNERLTMSPYLSNKHTHLPFPPHKHPPTPTHTDPHLAFCVNSPLLRVGRAAFGVAANVIGARLGVESVEQKLRGGRRWI
jgi:hypothetical protein